MRKQIDSDGYETNCSHCGSHRNDGCFLAFEEPCKRKRWPEQDGIVRDSKAINEIVGTEACEHEWAIGAGPMLRCTKCKHGYMRGVGHS